MLPPPNFPAFDLSRLLTTVFDPLAGSRIALLVDMEDPRDLATGTYLTSDEFPVQRKAYEVFYQGLQQGVLEAIGCTGGDLFAYKMTYGSNLDLPDEAFDMKGQAVSLSRDVYPQYDIILAITSYSATAPLTASAKRFGFRGATLHGVNDVIQSSGLSVDYREVSARAEKLRLGMTRADAVEIDTEVNGQAYTLRLELGGQEAQKSHGLCHGTQPDVANLPAGEVYFVPTGADGQFPLKHDDGTITLNHVQGGSIRDITLIQGDINVVHDHLARIQKDPACGEIGELGLGTQDLPFADADIQDEKVLGTVHVATGRSDHLGGHLTPEKFHDAGNATHDDLLFHPRKTPEIALKQVRMERDGQTTVLLEEYHPSAYLLELIGA